MAALTQPLDILHVITGLDAGGAEGMLAALATAAPSHGLRHSVVSLRAGGFHADRLRRAGIDVVELGLAPQRPDPRALWQLARLIRGRRPDLVQGWLYHGDLAALVGLALAGRRKATPLAWSLRCSSLDMAQYGIGLRLALALCTAWSSRPDVVVANSHAGLAAHLARGYRPRRSVVIPNGIDLARFAPDPAARAAIRSALGIAAAAPVIAHVARYDPMKDHATLLAALQLLPSTAICIAVGAGTERLPDVANLRRLGTRSDIPALLNAADIVVSSSAYGEGFSNVLAEGMAVGLPAVATDVGDARELVGEVGIVVQPRQPAALAAALGVLIDESEDARRARGVAGCRRIAERFSLDRAIADFAALYCELCQAPGAAATGRPNREGTKAAMTPGQTTI